MDIKSICTELKKGAEVLALHDALKKNHALQSVADYIEKNKAEIFKANSLDVEKARESGMSESLVDRLSLDDKKIASIISGLKTIISHALQVVDSEGFKNYMSNNANMN